MMRLKGCPRCNGDLIIDRDGNVWYEWCLQCGFERELESIVSLQPRTGTEAKSAKNA